MNSLIGAPGIETTSPTFRTKLVQTAQAVGAHPDHLATVISFESGFDPTKENLAGSGAVGLIQFTKVARDELGLSKSDIVSMSAEDQLALVQRHYARWGKGFPTLDDAYLAVVWPAAVGKGPDVVLMREGTKEYAQNAGFDVDKKGYITVRDVSAKIHQHHAVGLSRPRVPVAGAPTMPDVPRSTGGGGAFAFLVLLGIGVAIWKRKS